MTDPAPGDDVREATFDEQLRRIMGHASISPVFIPYVRYTSERDCLHVYLENEADYSEKLSDSIDLMRSMDDKRIVGLTIFGIVTAVRPIIEQRDETITQLRTDLANETKRANQWSTRHTELVERLTKAVIELEIAPEDQARSTGEYLLVSSLVGEIKKLRTPIEQK